MKKTIEYLKDKVMNKPQLGLILGSGLGMLADEITDPIYIPYEEIPNFPRSTVEGHAGRLVIGSLNGVTVMTMQGRFHYYEGYDMETITFPIRVMQNLGIKKLLVTNAAGGINLDYEAGTIMVIKDHINLMGTNPLIGKNMDQFGTRFPDMTKGYEPKYISIVETEAAKLNIKIRKGVYVGVTGPSYETPAEIKFLRIIGADAVGMSTVPEVIVAKHSEMKVLGISCITNMAAGITGEPLSHEEVVETAARVRDDFRALILKVIPQL